MRSQRVEIETRLIQLAGASPAHREQLVRDPRGFLAAWLGIEVPEGVEVSVAQETANHLFVVLPHVFENGAELSDSDLEAVAGGHTLVKEGDCGGGGVFQTVNSFEASIGAMGGGDVAAAAPVPEASPGGGHKVHG